MTINELIEALNKIENKNANVFIELNECEDAIVKRIDGFSKHGYIVLASEIIE